MANIWRMRSSLCLCVSRFRGPRLDSTTQAFRLPVFTSGGVCVLKVSINFILVNCRLGTMKSEMADDEVLLSFCRDCGVLRLRDVKTELQQLFAGKMILPDVCAICDKSASPVQDIDANLSSRKRVRTTLSVPTDECDESIKTATVSPRNERQSKSLQQGRNGDDSAEVSSSNKRQRKTKVSSVTGFKNLVEDSKQDVDVITGERPGRLCDDGAEVESSSAEDEEGPLGFYTSGTKVETDWKASSHHKSKEHPILPRKAKRLSTGVIAAREYNIKGNKDDDDDDDDDHENWLPSDDEVDIDRDDADDKRQTLLKIEQEESTVKKVRAPRTEGVNPEILAFTTPSDDPQRPFKCKLCINMYIPFLSLFQQHLKTHTGKEPMEKPYKCDVCGSDFRKPHDLKIHSKRMHTVRSDKFKCTYRNCKYTFSRKQDLKCHMEVHRGIKCHKCKTCGLGFLEKTRLAIHQTVHSEDRPFACEFCKKTFSHEQLLKEHRFKHLNRDRHRCDECNFMTRDRDKYEVHKQTHRNRGHFLCEKCKHVFSYQRGLDKHQELDKCKPSESDPPVLSNNGHEDVDISDIGITKWLNPKILNIMGKPRSSGTPFRCKLCPLVTEFKKVNPFLKHMRLVHSEEHVVDLPFRCDICQKGFTGFSELKNHLTVHSDERSHSCPECNNRFKTKYQLGTHMKTHRVPDQMCSMCAACFTSPTKLKLHIDRVHKKLRPCKCDRCERSFSDKGKLKDHIQRIHEDNRPWVCESCGRTFKIKMDLAAHLLMHKEKRFACDECDYRCVRPDYLTKHRRIHTGEKPYHCEACEMRFSNRTSLVLHQNKHHGGVVKPSVTSTAKSEGTAEGTMHLEQTDGNSVLVPFPTKPAVASGEASSVLASGDETQNAIESIAMIHFAHMQGAFSM